jgi:hypothetical protein
MDIMALGGAAEEAAAQGAGAGAETAPEPTPTPMTSQEFYGGSGGRIGQPDQAYFNEFVLPGSQGFEQQRLLNPMAHYAARKNQNDLYMGLVDERNHR